MKRILSIFNLLVIAWLFNTCNKPILQEKFKIGEYIQELGDLSIVQCLDYCRLKNFIELEQTSENQYLMAYEQSVEHCKCVDGFERIKAEFHRENYLVKYTFYMKDKRLFLAHLHDIGLKESQRFVVYYDVDQHPFRFLKDKPDGNPDFQERLIKDISLISSLQGRLEEDYLKCLAQLQ